MPEFVFSNFLLRVVAHGRVVSPRYLFLLLSGHLTRERVKRMVTGSTYPNLRVDEYTSALLPIPPLSEQAAIVRYLDHVDRRIQRYLNGKQKLIRLLDEQNQAVIHRAVTRGLDPNVRLKPSGVEWLGDVPAHWGISRTKNEFHCWNHRRVPLSASERGLMSVRRYDYYGASGTIDKVED